MIVIALLLTLFACWSFWGWTVGDSRDIRWIRHWCGAAFVSVLTLIAAGGGFLTAQSIERSAARETTFDALLTIADQIEAGGQGQIVRRIRELDHRGDPDEDAYDLLSELPQMTAKLKSRSVTTAARSASVKSDSTHR